MIDEELIQKAINKDKYAFRTIFSVYRQKVYRTAYLILKDHQLAEDSVQEIFLQIYLKINRLSSAKAFESWLYKITINTCYSVVRKSKSFATLLLDENIEQDITAAETDLDLPGDILLRKEIHKTIMDCVYSLPFKHRTVLVLFYANDMSIKQIADIIPCSQGTVKSRLFYGKTLLKEKLIAHGELIELPTGGVIYGS